MQYHLWSECVQSLYYQRRARIYFVKVAFLTLLIGREPPAVLYLCRTALRFLVREFLQQNRSVLKQ